MIRDENKSMRLTLRPATQADLSAVNSIIARAVHGWKLPDRVKRLVLPSYYYNELDMQHLHIEVADDGVAGIAGVAAWEAAAARDSPQGLRGLLLHGLYVDPDQQGQGVGKRLLNAAAVAAREQGCDGLLVKAQPDAEDFFRSRGLRQLAVLDEARDYPGRFWLDITK